MKKILIPLLCIILLSISISITANESKSISKTKNKVSNTTNSYYGQLQVKGSQLCDKKGNPVQLKGLSTHGIGWFPEYVNKKTFKTFKEDWNMNVIRLAMYTEENNGYCSSDNTQKKKLKALIHKGIKAAQDLDLYVIIDWHILSDGNPLTNIDEAKAFFKEISSKYKNDPHIIYEICNEPNGNTSWKDIKKYAKQIIPIIRKNAPDAIIIVGTPTWSQDVDVASESPITGYKNLMYALHFYANTHRDDLRNKMVTAIKNDLPVFVSEYGICDASGNGGVNIKEANKWVSLMDQYKVSYVAWNLSNKAESSAILKSSSSKTSSFTNKDLSESGKWLKSMLTGTTLTNSDKTNTSDTNNTSNTAKEPSKDTSVSTTNYKDIIESVQIDSSLKTTIVLDNHWEDSSAKYYLLRISIENTTSSPVNNWSFKLKTKKNTTLVDNWNSKVKISKKRTITITPAVYNQTINGNSSLTDIGIIIKVPN